MDLKTEYDPNSKAHRKFLAELLTLNLDKYGFVKFSERFTLEDVYQRQIEGVSNVYVVIYTSIENGCMRSVGSDAIRINLVFRGSEKTNTLNDSSVRINRTGTFESVLDRVHSALRKAYAAAKTEYTLCKKCQSPMAMSKNNKMYCMNTCWLT
jgi:hypothetical protein